MPTPPTTPTAAAERLIAESGLTACRAERERLEAHDADLLRELQAFTRDEARARRQAAGDLDLESLLDRQETGEGIRDAISRVQRERVENAGLVRQTRERYAAILAEVDKQVRALLMGARQQRVSAITLAAMALGDALTDDRQANTAAEMVMAGAGLRALGLENLLGGVHGRLCLTDSTLPPFDTLTQEWTAQGWLVGPIADRAAARALANRQALDRANNERNRRMEEGAQRARASMLAAQRARLASGEDRRSAKFDDGNWHQLTPAQAVERFDQQHGLKPQPKPKAPSRDGELISV